MEKTYLYMVHPRKVITGLSGATALRSPKSLLLTKEDVIICLQRASVYRRFAQEGMNVRVTIDAVDRLHNDHFIPEDKWDAEKGVEKDAPVVENKVEAPVVTPAPEVKEELKVEEPVKEEAPVVEEKVEEVVEEPVVEETNQVEEVEDDKQEELESSEDQQSVEDTEEPDDMVVEDAATETEEEITEDTVDDVEEVTEESAEVEEIEEETPVDESTDGEPSETEVAKEDDNKQQFNYHKKKKH